MTVASSVGTASTIWTQKSNNLYILQQCHIPRFIMKNVAFIVDGVLTATKIPPFWEYAGEQWQSLFIFIEDGATSIGPSYPEGMEPADEISFSYKILATDDFKIESDQSWIR